MGDPLASISRARTTLLGHAVFLGHLALRLRPRVALRGDRVRTAAVAADGTLVVNADYVRGLRPPEVTGLVAHEVMHVALEHHRRQRGREAVAWGLAADVAVNHVVEVMCSSSASRIVLPPGALLEDELRLLSAEEIYDLMLQQNRPRSSEPAGDLRDDLAETADGRAAFAGDMAAARRLAAEWRVAVAQAAQAHAAAGRGSLPGSLQRLIEGLGASTLDWKEQLSRWLGDHARRQELTYLRPGRRSESAEVMLPGPRRDQGLPDVVVMLDTSGSMEDRRLTDALSEVEAICVELGLAVRALVFDAAVHADLELEEARELLGRLKGGGGSDARPAFERLAGTGAGGVAIVFTDGDLCTPAEAPEDLRGVLWVLGDGDRPPASWGDVLRLPLTRGAA